MTMAQKGTEERKTSTTKITPPKKKREENLSRDEVRSLNKKKRMRKRKAKRIAALGVLAVVVLALGVLFAVTVFFKVNNVNVVGSNIYTQEEILLHGDIEIGSGLFSVNEKKLNESLPKRLPYIKSVTIKRELPDTLIIEIVQATPVVAFQNGAGYILADETGKVLKTDASEIGDDVAYVTGLSLKTYNLGENVAFNNEAVTENFISLITEMKNSELEGITGISINEKNEFELMFDGRIKIKLGSMTNIDKKLQRAKAALDKEKDNIKVGEGVIDLSIEPYAYVKPGPEEEVTIPAVFVTDADGNVVTDAVGNFVTTEPVTAEGEEAVADED